VKSNLLEGHEPPLKSAKGGVDELWRSGAKGGTESRYNEDREGEVLA